MNQPPLVEIPTASAQVSTPALFSTPGTDDFLSLAISLMPTIEGANLNISETTDTTSCDLLVPVTYIDAGCMNSLPLLFPFTVQENITEPLNETLIYGNYSDVSTLALSIGVASENVTAGETQTVTVSVSDGNSTEPVGGAEIFANLTDSYYEVVDEYSGITDAMGQVSFPFVIPVDALSDFYEVSVLASADGYDNATASTTFEVVGSEDFFYDNSTFDESTSDDYNYDDGSSSSSDGNNDDFDSPTVKSVDPNDNQNDVSLNTEIKVTFDENMDQDTLDDNSLDIFNLNGIDDPGVNANPSSKSVTYTLDRQLEPGTRYEAQLDFNIQDDNGNYLDCSNSNDVDSSCTWQFDTTGTSTSARITLTPTSGPVGTLVTVTGFDFDPNSEVIVTFAGASAPPVPTNNNGGFTATFTVPPLSPTGPVSATDGFNIASSTFTVTTVDLPPTVVSTIPASGATGVSVVDPITGTFSEPVQSSTVTESTFTLKKGTTSVEGSVTLSSDGKTAIFDQDIDLDTETPYTATITGIKDLAGNTMVSAKEWSFTTTIPDASAPSVEATIPEDGDTVPVSVAIEAIFSEGMSKSTITTGTFTLKTGTTSIPGTVTHPDGETAIFDPSSNLAPSAVYEATIKGGSNGVKDLAGNAMISDYSWSFTTAAAFTAGNIETTMKPTISSLNQSNTSFTDLNSSNSFTNNIQSDGSSGSDALMKNQTQDTSIGTVEPDNKSLSVDTSTVKPEEETIPQDTSVANNSRADNRADSDSSQEQIKEDRALFDKYLQSSGGDNEKLDQQNTRETNNRPVATDDKATTNTNVPVNINILANDKDSDDDKLSIMGLSPPRKGTVVISDSDGTITYSPLKSWAGTETFTYTISDSSGGVAAASVTVIVQNRLPEAQDQSISVSENNPVKIKLEAKDPDDNNLRFIVVSQPSHGRIVQFSSSAGTLGYIPDENFDGKDSFTFKVNDGIADSKNAEVSIQVENIKDADKERRQQQEQQQEQSTPPADQQSTSDKSSSDNKSSETSSDEAKDEDQQPSDDQQQKEEEDTSPPPEEQSSTENTGDSTEQSDASSDEQSSSSEAEA